MLLKQAESEPTVVEIRRVIVLENK